MDIERTFVVKADPHRTFAYLADFENTNEWDPGTIQTHRIAGDGGVGTQYQNKSEFLGREVELVYETVEYVPDTRVRFRGTNKSSTTYDTLSVRAVTEGAEITYHAEFQFKFPINILAPLFAKGKVKELADETVEQLTQALEKG